MQILARKTLVEFWAKHPETRPSLERWVSVVKAASWSSIAEVRMSFPKAKALNGERVRFEIFGGNYRMIVAFDLTGGRRLAFIKFIGTHADYDAIDAFTISLF